MHSKAKGFLIAALLLAAGCNSGHGRDSLFSRQTPTNGKITDCLRCHTSANSPALDPLVSNGSGTFGKHIKHAAERKIPCERCHYGYIDRATHMNGTMDSRGTVNVVSFNIVGPSGAWVSDTGAGTGSCSGVACHGSGTLDWYGTNTWTTPTACTTCHSSAFSAVLDPVLTNGTGASGKHGKHVATIGLACSKCHINYPSRTTHASGALDTQDPAVLLVYFDAANSGGAWTGDTGQETGSCASTNCHSGETPTWYGTAGVSTPPCATCHVRAMGTRRPVLGANGDFGAAARTSHHITGATDPATDQCLVCHDMSVHMGGTVRLRNGDTGAVISYTSAAAAEPFCLSCHDASGAVSTFRSGGTPTAPFTDGSIIGQAPYRASADVSANWNKSYGHRQKGLTCLGDGTPNTGCHGNGHGTTNVGLLARNLTLPITKTNSFRAPIDELDHDLCLTCHASYNGVRKEDVLGMSATGNYAATLLTSYSATTPYATTGIRTLFRDVSIGITGKAYDDWSFFGGYLNLHIFHVQMGPSAWKYRGVVDSSVSCLACHSMHGSNSAWGWVYDEMQFDHYAGSGMDQYGMLGLPAALGNHPTSCTWNCHDPAGGWFFGPTHSWFEPSQE